MTCILDDDESEIEAEIQRELDALQDDSLHCEDFESDNSLSKTNESKEDFLPDSLQEYIKLLKSRTEGAEEEVKECEIILEKLPHESSLREDETLLAKRIKDELGEECAANPLVLRDKVLSELEEAERHERVRETKDDNDQLALGIIHPDVIDEISALEETAQQQLQELEEKQASKDQERKEWFEKQREEEETRKATEKEARAKRQMEFEVAQRKLVQEQKALQTKLDNEAREEERRLQVMEEQFQVQLMVLEEERKKESEAFVEAQCKEAEYQQKKVEAAATKLQKFYRGFRIRKQYKPLLEAKRLQRIQRKKEELDAIEIVEKRLREEAEKRKVKEEQKRKEQEEKKKIEEQEKLKRQEQAEKKRRLEQEQRKQDEEKRRKEEEHRRRVEEERKKQELEEEKRRKEEEQKQREAEHRGKIEEQRRKAEEENRRKIEVAKRQEEEDRQRIEEAEREEERRLKKSEEKMMQEQRQRKEEEEEWKRKDGERKIEERRRKELENKEQVEDSKKEEENKCDTKLIVSSDLLVTTTERKFTEKKDVLNSKQSRQQEENNLKEENTQLGCALSLRNDLELRRQKWIQEHTPWSKMSSVEKRTHAVAKNRPRRAFSAAKHLPTLTEEQLLNSCPNVPLHKVKVIILKNLPSCRMQGISRCPDLQSLVLHNCGVLTVEGLEHCKQLLQLHIEENQVEAINCKDLSNLEEISLKNNNLTSVHGLEGCSAMKLLDLCNNKITRIGDLSSCGKLQRLLLDNNQLINTKGLTSVPCLQSLSLAHNHLAHISDIERCVLLQSLNLQSNNLQEAPQLVNCVLLRVLHLDDNSISSLESLSTCWLPSLQILSVSQNSLSQLASLSNLLVLDTLDISNNLISDTNSLISGLQECGLLRMLKIVGNPVHEEPSCRTAILEALPSLTILDGETVSEAPIIEADSFTAMCLKQLQDQDALNAQHQRETRAISSQPQNPEAILQRLRLVSHHNNEWFQLAVKHLQQHENFNPSNYPVDMKDIHSAVRTVGETSGPCDSMIGELRVTNTQAVESLNPRAAATKIQAFWRGWHIRHLIDAKANEWMAAVTIQAVWRGYRARLQFNKEPKERWDPVKHSAATVIQAHFRGRRVRRRLADALQAAQFYDESDEEFDYDEEVDLSAFNFDENTLEEGWIPSNTPQLPPRGPVLKQPAQTSRDLDTSFSREILNDAVTLKPRQAWRSADSPITDINQAPVAKATADRDARSVTSGMQSHVSHRAEELSNEWGFRNSETAELMIRRARKMKYNPARRKKMLDPNKRLALFKKLEETNKLHDVRPPPNRKQPPKRVEYFSAREAMAAHMASQSPSTEQQTKEQLTYSWVYRQAVVHEDEERNIMADHREYELENRSKKTSPEKSSRSSVSLPYMDRAVLAGRTLPLVSSPLFSHSAVETSPEGNSARSNSFSSEGHVRFPAIKTYSVPNLLARSSANGEQSMRTEKSNSAGARINREARNRR